MTPGITHPSFLRDLTASPAAPQLCCALSWNLPAQQTRSIFLSAPPEPLRAQPLPSNSGNNFEKDTGASLTTASSFFSRCAEQEQSSPRPSETASEASPAPGYQPWVQSRRERRGTGAAPALPGIGHQPRDGKCLHLKIHIYRGRTQREEGKLRPLPTPSERR